MRTLILVSLGLFACDSPDAPAAGVSAVEAAVADLRADVDDLGAVVDRLGAAVDALGAAPSPAAPCPDVMVLVGDTCVDRWKASVWDTPACDGSGVAFGVEAPDYPAGFPASGDWTTPVYACSLEGVVPAGNLTWFQAAQACALSGKRLCTNAEWQVAVSGTPSDVDDCALEAGRPVPTGAYAACVSRWGTHDQVGIRWEWTADWVPGGAAWMTPADADRARATPWPATYGDGADYTLNLNGQSLGAGTMVQGLPSAVIRGGDYSNGSEGGSFAMSLARGPSHLAPYIGFRCCQHRAR